MNLLVLLINQMSHFIMQYTPPHDLHVRINNLLDAK